MEPAGANASYQWLSATTEEGEYSEITAANGNTYALTANEQGKYIKVRATGAGSYDGMVESTAAGPVVAAAQEETEDAGEGKARAAHKK